MFSVMGGLSLLANLAIVHTIMQALLRGGGERAWYIQTAHAPMVTVPYALHQQATWRSRKIIA